MRQCIIFIRDYNSKGQEISGYIDYAHRIKTEVHTIIAIAVTPPHPIAIPRAIASSQDFSVYFKPRDGKKEPERLLPKPSDLSYYNWDTQTYDCFRWQPAILPQCVSQC